jgi:DNA-binding response OmpR family regulator
MASILVAEDQPELRSLLRLALQSAHHTTHEAKSGTDALAFIRDDTFIIDLFLTDFHMPDMDGFDAIREAYKLRPGLPCVMVTGDDHVLHSPRLAKLDIGIIRKPFAIRALLATIDDLLGEDVTITGRPDMAAIEAVLSSPGGSVRGGQRLGFDRLQRRPTAEDGRLARLGAEHRRVAGGAAETAAEE